MTKLKKSKASISPQLGGVPTEFLGLLPRIRLFPGEDETSYEGLRAAFMLDLAPGTPYEMALAENLVTLEWETIRHRNIRDDLIIAKFRELAMDVFSGQSEFLNILGSEHSADVKELALALVDPDASIRGAAETELAARQITPSELIAKAYASVAKTVEIHERILAANENRRRRLRDDYDRLKAARASPVEEAEILDF